MSRPPRLVLDTNVVISAVLWGGKPGELIAAAGEGAVWLHSDRLLLDELRASLERPKLARRVAAKGLTPDAILADYRHLVTLTRRVLPGAWSRDRDDDRVIACAIAARADWIVTGDDDLLSLREAGGVAILTVAEMLTKLA
jgi:putative PIN family toxin of toxin-antitoxin system